MFYLSVRVSAKEERLLASNTDIQMWHAAFEILHESLWLPFWRRQYLSWQIGVYVGYISRLCIGIKMKIKYIIFIMLYYMCYAIVQGAICGQN